MTDPIADMLTRIRNANQMRNKEVSMPVSKMKVEIAKILDAEGFITNYTVNENTLTLTLKYGQNKERVITGLKRISKPGLRVYAKNDNIITKIPSNHEYHYYHLYIWICMYCNYIFAVEIYIYITCIA